LAVAVAGGVLGFKTVQPEGKQKLSAKDYYNGQGEKIIGKRFTGEN